MIVFFYFSIYLFIIIFLFTLIASIVPGIVPLYFPMNRRGYLMTKTILQRFQFVRQNPFFVFKSPCKTCCQLLLSVFGALVNENERNVPPWGPGG